MGLNDGVEKSSLPPHCSSWELAVYVVLGGFISQEKDATMCSCDHGRQTKQTMGQTLEEWYK